MKKKYEIEREGQLDFFKNIGYKSDNIADFLIENTDGVINGNLLEFKLSIDNLNSVLGQAIKYLSRMRLKGEPVPANILLISLNTTTAYLYHSQDYFDDIHKIYDGAASKNNDSFVAQQYINKYDYDTDYECEQLKQLLKTKNYMKIRLDEDCIVGWAEKYYRDIPTATKGDFLGDDEAKIKIVGEIREPKEFKDYILPYTERTNEKFKFVMDKLNDRLNKKDLGAFYTPIPYCEKAAELVRKAIARVPKGNDYIILDRCAGTGNLESVLTDEELSHCIVSTYEYWEWRVLFENLGSKVRHIIPPAESRVQYSNGYVSNADAMSEEFINHPTIKQYIDNPKCTIILYENPPYRDVTSNSTGKAKEQNSFVLEQMRNCISGSTLNELTNRFIWSGYQFYLRQPTDSYVLFSPAKYFKICELSNKEMIKGYLFNRTHFHATPSAITCILWANIDCEYENLNFEIFDIKDNEAVLLGTKVIRKSHSIYSSALYDKRTFDLDNNDGICCNLDGTERIGSKGVTTKRLFNDNIVAYIRASSFNFDALSKNLLRCAEYDGHGFFVRKDNYLEKLPLWVAKQIPLTEWHEKEIYATSGDGGDKYTKDKEFLKYCLIYTCLSNQNKCLSFKGSDNREYQNELCFEENTLAYKDLQKFKNEIGFNPEETELLSIFEKILAEAKQTKKYDSNWKYGIYQITKELNTFTTYINSMGKEEKEPDYNVLNGDLETLRVKLKEYYKKYITPKMFEYELLK